MKIIIKVVFGIMALPVLLLFAVVAWPVVLAMYIGDKAGCEETITYCAGCFLLLLWGGALIAMLNSMAGGG